MQADRWEANDEIQWFSSIISSGSSLFSIVFVVRSAVELEAGAESKRRKRQNKSLQGGKSKSSESTQLGHLTGLSTYLRFVTTIQLSHFLQCYPERGSVLLPLKEVICLARKRVSCQGLIPIHFSNICQE